MLLLEAKWALTIVCYVCATMASQLKCFPYALTINMLSTGLRRPPLVHFKLELRYNVML